MEKYKIIECKFWKEGIENSCHKGIECTYTHGEKDIRTSKKNCFKDIKCFNHLCNYAHPESWNPYENKKICTFYTKGECKKGNSCLYLHENNNDIIKNTIMNELYKNTFINIKDEDEFPILSDHNQQNNDKFKNSYSSCLKSEINEFDIKNDKDEINNDNIEIVEDINENSICLNISFNNNKTHIETINKVENWCEDNGNDDSMCFKGDTFDDNVLIKDKQHNDLQNLINTIELFRKTIDDNRVKLLNNLSIDESLKVFVEKEISNIKYNIKYIENIKN